MNRTLSTITLALLTCAPAGAATSHHARPKPTAHKPAHRWETDAWGNKPLASHAERVGAKSAARAIKPTVEVHAEPAGHKTSAPHVAAKPQPADSNPTKPAAEKGAVPGLPISDLNAPSTGKEYTSQVEDFDRQLSDQIAKVAGLKPGQDEDLKGVGGAETVQSRLAKALGDPSVSDADKVALKNLQRQRDTSLYLLGAYFANLGDPDDACRAWRTVAKSAGPGTQTYDVIARQLANMGRKM